MEPGRIENYTIGRGTLAQQEAVKVRKRRNIQVYTFKVDEKYLAECGVEMWTRILMVWFQGGLTKSTGGGIEGCGITKYSGSHSFNPLLLSKSSNNLSVKKVFLNGLKFMLLVCRQT